MTFSRFDRRLLEEGLVYFDRPRLAGLLEMLGSTRFERVEALVAMLRHSPPEEFDEAVALFERATAQAARDRARNGDEGGTDQPGRRRPSRSAERREERRR